MPESSLPANLHVPPRFLPAEHGFRFVNDFPDARYQAPPPHGWRLCIEGRAGGMVYAALDYWSAEGYERPADTETPPDGDILADYIALRQRDAFAGVAAELVMATQVDGVVVELRRACRPPHGRVFLELVRSLRAGRPCPLGLVPMPEAITPDAEGRGHHVLAVSIRLAPEPSDVEVGVYDPSRPGREVILQRDPDGPGWCLRDPGEATDETPRDVAAWFIDRGYAPRLPDIRDARSTVVDLSNQDLRKWEPPPKQDLQDYRLVGVDLRGHDGLSSLDLQGVDARGARLDEAILRRCDLRRCDLREASLRRADLTGSTLDGARLSGADLEGALLHRSSLRRVLAAEGLRLTKAELHEAQLADAVLEGVNASEVSVVGAGLARARLDRAQLSHATIRGGSLADASLSGAVLVQASITGTRFDGGADLRGAVLTQATLRGVSFVGADLRGAKLIGATLTDVDFRFCDLRGADLSNARLEHVVLTGAACEGARFPGAIATDMVLTPDVLARLRGQGVPVKVEQLVVRTPRTQIGGPALALHGGRHGLYMVRPGTGEVWRWEGLPHAWTRVGGPGGTFAVTDDALFGLTRRRDAVMWHEREKGWTKIGGPARRLWAGGLGLFVEIPGSGELFRWDGAPDRWTRVSGAGAAFAVTDDELFRLSPGRDEVLRWTDERSWERIGGPATELYAGGLGLFAARPPSGEVWRWEGEADRWTRACEASAAVAVGQEELYRLTPSRDAVIRVLGSASLAVGGPADEIAVAGDGLYAIGHRTRDVWRLV